MFLPRFTGEGTCIMHIKSFHVNIYVNVEDNVVGFGFHMQHPIPILLYHSVHKHLAICINNIIQTFDGLPVTFLLFHCYD